MDDSISNFVPQQLDELNERIQLKFNTLSKRQKEIASFMLAHPEAIALSTLSELENRININASAFVRFSKQMGFSGFSELQSLHKQSLERQWPNYSSRLSGLAGLPEAEGLSTLTAAAANSILKMDKDVDTQRLKNAVEMLRDAEMIWLVANGRTLATHVYLSYMLTRLGIKNQQMATSAPLAHDQMGMISPKDVLMASSFAPYSDLSTSLVVKAKAEKQQVLTVTDTMVSPIYQPSSLLVNETDIQGFRSICATVTLFQYLAIETGRQRLENT